MPGVLVHEWLARTGGSENVFESLGEIFPDAMQVCLWNDSGDRFPRARETILARTPFRYSKASAAALAPIVWRNLPAWQADWLLCSTHLFAHHAKLGASGAQVPKFVYAHTPARYIWTPELDPRGQALWVRPIASILKSVDRRRAQEPVAIAANSSFVAGRISAAWRRTSTVIYPPVALEQFLTVSPDLSAEETATLDGLPERFLLGASRFVAYKRLDYAIRAGAASGMPVVLAGAGPEEPHLADLASRSGVAVRFVRSPTTQLLAAIYRRAAAMVFGAVEDFGIMPIECMATGTPVIANAVGGTSETILNGKTGVLIHDWSDRELRAAVATAETLDPNDCVTRANDFSEQVFKQAILRWMGLDR